MKIKLNKLPGVFLITAFAIAPSVSSACAWHMFSMLDFHLDASVANDDKGVNDDQQSAADPKTPAHSPRVFGVNSFSKLHIRSLESNTTEMNMPSVNPTSAYKTIP